MIKIKTFMFRKHTLYLRVIFSVLVEKCRLCDHFPNPLHQKLNNSLQYETYDFAHNITNILDIQAIFIFYIEFYVTNEAQMLFASRTLSLYFPWYQTLKIYIQEITQKLLM